MTEHTGSEVAMNSAALMQLLAHKLEDRIAITDPKKDVTITHQEAIALANTLRDGASIIDKLGLLLGDR